MAAMADDYDDYDDDDATAEPLTGRGAWLLKDDPQYDAVRESLEMALPVDRPSGIDTDRSVLQEDAASM